MRPEDALSPQRYIKDGSLEVVYTSPDGTWSLARMVWEHTPVVGIRWNGDINDPQDKGNPRSHNKGTWFILPDPVGRALATLAETFRTGHQ